MGVDALVLEQAQQVQAAAVGLPVIDEALPQVPGPDAAVRQPVVQAFQLLDDDAAGPHVQVADFAGALVAVGQAHGFAGGVQQGPGIFLFVPVDVGGAGRQNGVPSMCG